MGHYGRPRLPEKERRAALSLNVRFSVSERIILTQKAAAAGLTATAWARYAALIQTPPLRRIIPTLNAVAWLELAPLAQAVRVALTSPDSTCEHTRATLEHLQTVLARVRNQLIGNDPEELQ